MKKTGIAWAASLLLLGGCGLNQKEVQPEDGFLKIYNHPEEQLSFYPVSLLEGPGGGYYILSAVKDDSSDIQYPSAHLIRTGPAGSVTWSQTYDWLAPSPGLYQAGGSIGFVAMNGQLDAFALEVDPDAGEIRSMNDLEMTLPLEAYKDSDGNLLVLGYDFVSRSSWISKFNGSYSLERSNKLPVNSDIVLSVEDHLDKSGEQFPFFIGEYSTDQGTGYYVSCFSNYTVRTVFLDISSLNATGDIFSFQTDEAVSSAIHKGGSLFGFTGYYEGNNYIVPSSEVNVTASQSIRDFETVPLHELTDRAPVVTASLETDEGPVALFASQTNTNSVVWYQYPMESDSLADTRYRTFDQRVEIADLVPTTDGGIALLARIYILGKYPRPVLVKEPERLFNPED